MSSLDTGLVPAILMQLLFQGPTLLIYIIGSILAIVMWQRARTPALLLLIGVGVLLLSAIFGVVVQNYALYAGDGVDIASRGALMGLIGFLTNIMHAVGVLLLVLAAFAGRKAPTT